MIVVQVRTSTVHLPTAQQAVRVVSEFANVAGEPVVWQRCLVVHVLHGQLLTKQ